VGRVGDRETCAGVVGMMRAVLGACRTPNAPGAVIWLWEDFVGARAPNGNVIEGCKGCTESCERGGFEGTVWGRRTG